MARSQFTRKEIEGRNHREDAAFVIDNVVYDVTQFLREHPGGAEALLDNAGADATRSFSDVGHSHDARALMQKYAVGELVESDRWQVETTDSTDFGDSSGTAASLLVMLGPPLALAAASIFLYSYVL
ncbi:cytochrome b5-like [Achroia grisella]|uniref:cytochrome b5-like n=1 Tax=Achroia grisella TaxID=688607 RepID=UPI0027D32807|nr:cytochrome b5-like [Achroia grisella]